MPDQDGYYPLHLAVMQNNLDAFENLIEEKNADVNQLSDNPAGVAPIHLAVIHGNFNLLQRLIAYNAKWDLASGEGLHISHYAVEHGQIRILFYLGKFYPSIFKVNDVRKNLSTANVTAWEFAIEKGELEIIKKLILLNLVNLEEALILAVEVDQPDMVEYLVKEHAIDVNCVSNSKTAFSIAIQCDSINALKKLISLGATYHPKKDAHILKKAVELDDPDEMLNYLIQTLDFDVNAKDDEGNTIIRHCIINGFVNSLKILLEHKADIHSSNEEKFSPLHLAVIGNTNIEMVEFLLDLNLDMNMLSFQNRTPLDYAIFSSGSISDVIHILELFFKHSAKSSLFNDNIRWLADCMRKENLRPAIKLYLALKNTFYHNILLMVELETFQSNKNKLHPVDIHNIYCIAALSSPYLFEKMSKVINFEGQHGQYHYNLHSQFLVLRSMFALHHDSETCDKFLFYKTDYWLTGYVQEKMKHIKTLGNVERKFLNTLTQQETMMVDDKAEVITKSALYYENIKIERIANFILPLLLVTKNKNPFLGLSHDTFNLIMEWIIVKPYSHTKPAQVFQALMQSSQKKIAPTPPFHIEQRIGFFQCLIDQKEENSRKRKELSF